MTESVKQFYSEHPEKQDRNYTRDKLPEKFLELRDRFIGLLDGKTVLDAGCGPGRDTSYFMENGLEATGIDIAEGMVEYARRNRDGDFRQADIRDTGLESSSFDGIWCCASIFFMPPGEMEDAIREMERLLKPGGILYVDFKAGEGEKIKQKWGSSVKEYHLEREEAVEMLETAGFELIDSTSNRNPGGKKFLNFLCRKPI